MSSVTFDQLLDIYRNTTFDDKGDEGSLLIADASVLKLLELIENDEEAGRDANIVVLSPLDALAVGKTARIRIRGPKYALGLLVRSFDDLLDSRNARMSEPPAYFVIEGRLERTSNPPAPIQFAYRRALDFMELLQKAATYVDATRQELVFVNESRTVVPLTYDVEDLQRISATHLSGLKALFEGGLHEDQKLAILAKAVVGLTSSQPAARRLPYLFENLEEIFEETRGGYRLFASSFSYAKIRSELEAAKIDFISKIHRTIVDIQGQLLGIPVATIVVASQMKRAADCGAEFWTDVAVVAGAWIFLIILFIALTNQWLTLSSISDEIGRQRRKLTSNYAEVGQSFAGIFDCLFSRILWHRGALVVIALIALAGASFATYTFGQITPLTLRQCIR